MSAGCDDIDDDDDDDARNCFSKFGWVSLEQKRLFARVSFEKNCSKWHVVPNRDANFRAGVLRMAKSLAWTYSLWKSSRERMLYLALSSWLFCSPIISIWKVSDTSDGYTLNRVANMSSSFWIFFTAWNLSCVNEFCTLTGIFRCNVRLLLLQGAKVYSVSLFQLSLPQP